MQLPFYQVSDKFLTVQGPYIAGILRMDPNAAIGIGMRLFAFAVDMTSTKDCPPSGVFAGPHAAADIEAGVQWTGQPGALVEAFIRAGVIERAEESLRIRGMDRYGETWKKNRRRRPDGLAEKPGGSGEKPGGRAGKPPRNREGDGDGYGDGSSLLSEERDLAASGPAPLFDLPVAEKAKPSGKPVTQKAETERALSALQAVWNETTTAPLPRWVEMPKDRQAAALAALKRRPLEQWREVFRRIEASPFCRGHNDRGWVANVDWAMRPAGQKPEPAARILEGGFDDRQPVRPANAVDVAREVGRSAPPPQEPCAICGGESFATVWGQALCGEHWRGWGAECNQPSTEATARWVETKRQEAAA